VSIKEKHRGWMKYAAFRGARAFQLEPPPEYVRRNARQEEQAQRGSSVPLRRNKRREKYARVNLTGEGTREEYAAWRDRHVASIPRFGLAQVQHRGQRVTKRPPCRLSGR